MGSSFVAVALSRQSLGFCYRSTSSQGPKESAMSNLRGRSIDEESMLSSNSINECPKCDKTLSSKYSLKRHMESFHSGRKRKDEAVDMDGDSTDMRESEDSDEEEPTNYVWRRLLKRVLRQWDKDGRLPTDENDLITEKNLAAIRRDLRDQMVTVLNDHTHLVQSPIYQKIEKTRERLKKTAFGDSDEEDEQGAFDAAYKTRETLLDSFIEDNSDVLETLDESTDEEESDDESEEEDD